MLFERFRFWTGILMALDSMILLAAPSFWQRRFPGIRILRLAYIEAAAAMIILAFHYFT